ncbi:MAG: hypothetical protein IMZ53_11425 [Thermoplasmata archaeon]|nr:hypothetical protein [Thermoplasmata archaeon]
MTLKAKNTPSNTTPEPENVNPDASREEIKQEIEQITDNTTKTIINPILGAICDNTGKEIELVNPPSRVGLRGRPRINPDIKQLKKKIDKYLQDTTEQELTICGLALACGYCERQTIYDQMARNDIFSVLIKRAHLRVENAYEKMMRKQNCTGSIFVLKNMGWVDKLDTGGGVFINIVPK